MLTGRILRIPVLRFFAPRVPILPFSRARTFATSAPRRFFQLPRGQRLTSPRSNGFSTLPPASEGAPTMTSRLKALIKSYGWFALGAYLFFSAIDFSFVFGCVYFIGAEHVQRMVQDGKAWVMQTVLHSEVVESPEQDTHPTPGGREGLWAMIILAYGIHKTLLMPVRLARAPIRIHLMTISLSDWCLLQ